MTLCDPYGLFMGKIFHFDRFMLYEHYFCRFFFNYYYSTGKMMNILSDFGKDEQVKKVALKTGISGKRSTISALQIVFFCTPCHINNYYH